MSDASALSVSSPRERSHSPLRHRPDTDTDTDLSPRPRLSPVHTRSSLLHDRERQRTLDADMAMHLSRARSDSIAAAAAASPISPHRSAPDDQPLPPLSIQEEHDLDLARGAPTLPDPITAPPPDPHLNHLSAGHDPSLLVSLDPVDQEDTLAGLPMYQPSAPQQDRQDYDYAHIEQFARDEKAKLGIPTSPTADGKLPRPSSSSAPPNGAGSPSTPNALPEFTIPFALHRPRQRKISQSTGAAPRRGKMALFEQPGSAPPPSLAYRPPHLAPGESGTLLSAVPSYDNLPAPHSPGGIGSGHDRPYRFSFYSNALSATIHARSLSELPAEGQTFKDLFAGVPPIHPQGPAPGVQPPSRPGSATPMSMADLSQVYTKAGPGMGGGGGGEGGRSGTSSPGSNTWWLDVQSPTDDEMKVLSKVFAIHPLTTEDIQMEETREKIELFRNYYLVCFRSFEQDPYSPTYLEPLNMYIIVFREGILSFHFRPMPHPQNVRRRIKQLKDYISVTSDWISYALIDDITDAFGPLIQSIEYEVDSIDELVLILKEAEQSDMLRRIGTCRKKVMGLLRLMGNKADVVKGLAKRCNENWRVAPTSDIGLYLSDIQDHLITMTQNLNHYEKILSRSHSNYLAQISIEMTDANNQINDVLSKLTALGTVLIPMNLVTGLWGMNVHVPGQDVPTLTWFFSIIGVLAAFAIVAGWGTYKVMVTGR